MCSKDPILSAGCLLFPLVLYKLISFVGAVVSLALAQQILLKLLGMTASFVHSPH